MSQVRLLRGLYVDGTALSAGAVGTVVRRLLPTQSVVASFPRPEGGDVQMLVELGRQAEEVK